MPMSGGSASYHSRKPCAILLLRLSGAQVGAGGGHPRDAQRHLGVVAPLAGRDAAEAAADHLRLADEVGGAVLVRHAERVAGGLSDQNSYGPIGLLAVEAHGHPLHLSSSRR
jgi:hypothetical protein